MKYYLCLMIKLTQEKCMLEEFYSLYMLLIPGMISSVSFYSLLKINEKISFTKYIITSLFLAT